MPDCVSVRDHPTRSNSITPSWFSRAATCLPSVGCVRPSARAAADNEPSSAVAKNARAWFQSNAIDGQFMHFCISHQRNQTIYLCDTHGYDCIGARRSLMHKTAKFWDKAAAKYAKSPIEDIEAYNYTIGRTRSYLSPTDRVLEVGCGTGSTALLLGYPTFQVGSLRSSLPAMR